MPLPLQKQWNERFKEFAVARELLVESKRLNNVADKLYYAENDILHTEGSMLYVRSAYKYAEYRMKEAESDIKWLASVIKYYGNVSITWKSGNCIVDGDTYIALVENN
jgi:hypothetical protein